MEPPRAKEAEHCLPHAIIRLQLEQSGWHRRRPPHPKVRSPRSHRRAQIAPVNMRAEGPCRQPGEEGGECLFIFTRLPPSQRWRLRTTNAIECLHEEFKRRIETHRLTPLRYCSGRCFNPVKPTCARSTVGGRAPQSQLKSRLTLQPVATFMFLENAPHGIPATFRTAPTSRRRQNDEMNICYLVSYFGTQAGTESSIYHMSMAMAELGHNVHIVSLTGKGQWDFKSFADRIAVHQFGLQDDIIRHVRRAEDFFPVSAWRYGRSIKRILPALVNDHGIDIIEATDWGMDALAYLPTRQIPVCVRLHGYPGFKVDFDNHILKKWPKNRINWYLQRHHILGADLVTGVSEAYVNFVRQAWEIKDKEIQIIPIGINLNIFHPTDASREAHSILFAGRLEKLKGIEVLEQAISMVLRQMPRTQFRFAGVDHYCDNHRQTWSQRLIERYGRDHVSYLGSLSTRELVRYYQQSTICVVPSLYEPGATVALEAMACGCPILATRVGGLADIIKDRKTGLLSPTGDSAALAEDLIELLRNRELRQDLSQNALESIRQNFEINRIRQKTLTAYSNAIDQFRCLVKRQQYIV